MEDALRRLLSGEWPAGGPLPQPGEALVLVGAGELGRESARRLAERGWSPTAFLDETPSLAGAEIDGVPVLALSDAVATYGESAWFAVTIWSARHQYLRTRERLRAAGCARVCSFLDLAWSEPEALLPHYGFDLPASTLEHRARIEDAFRVLADDTARRQFLAHLRFRLARDHAALPVPSIPAYLDPQLVEPLERVTYVDGGAYNGDTLMAFLHRYESQLDSALVFEPDPGNYERLLESVSGLAPAVRARVRCHRAALSDEDGEARLAARRSEASAIVPAGGLPVETVRLDALVSADVPGRVLIKLDVEGHEQAAIRGAEHTIRATAPVVVACLYHRPADLWEIPLLLHELRPDFRLHVRTEGTDGAGLVCYAVP